MSRPTAARELCADDLPRFIAWCRARGARAETIDELRRISSAFHRPPTDLAPLSDAEFFVPENNVTFGVAKPEPITYVLNRDPERGVWAIGPEGDLRDLPHRVKHIERLAALLMAPEGIAGTHPQAAALNRLLQR